MNDSDKRLGFTTRINGSDKRPGRRGVAPAGMPGSAARLALIVDAAFGAGGEEAPLKAPWELIVKQARKSYNFIIF